MPMPTPEMYADKFGHMASNHTVHLIFMNSIDGAPTARCIIQLPNAVAKELAMVLRKHIKELEARAGTIALPANEMENLELAMEDW